MSSLVSIDRQIEFKVLLVLIVQQQNGEDCTDQEQCVEPSMEKLELHLAAKSISYSRPAHMCPDSQIMPLDPMIIGVL